MRNPRRMILVLLLLFSLHGLLTGCSAQPEEEAVQTAWTFPYPSSDSYFVDGEPYASPGFEKDLSNFVTYTEYSVYPTDVEKVIAFVKNTNPGTGFDCYKDCLIERYVDGEWVQLLSNRKSYGTWGFGINYYDPPRPELQYVTGKTYYMKYVAEEVVPGDYRVVSFVGHGVLYAPFQFVTPEEYAQMEAEGLVEYRETIVIPPY